MEKEVKAVIFDVAGVLALTQNSKGVHEFIADKLKISIDTYFDSIDTYYAKSIEGKISEKQTVKNIAKNLRISERKLRRLYKRAYKKNFKINKQLYKQAFKLKKRGYKIAILSDQWHLSKQPLIPDKYERKFNQSIISYKVKLRKPNPKIYKLTLKKLNLSPRQALFIDNRDWNTKPAKKIGIQTILFKSNKQLFKHPKWRKLFNETRRIPKKT